MKTNFSYQLFLCATALVLGILGHTTAQAQSGGVPLWTNRYNGPASGNDYSTAVAVDSSGNVFVTGYSAGGGSGIDYATIKYSGGGVPLWTNRYNGPGTNDDTATAAAVDGGGNVIVTGYSGYSPHVTGGSLIDYATIKYSGAGVPLWTNRYNGPGNDEDQGAALVVDGGDNVVVAGSSMSRTNYDYATIKYSGGGVPLWTNRYNGTGDGNDYVLAVAVDGSSNVFVTGYSLGSGTTADFATIKYSGDGIPLWTNRYSSPGNNADSPAAIAVDSSGNVFVTGFSGGTGIGADYATIKYSGAGVPLWTNLYNGPGNSADLASAMATDGAGNVIVTGFSTRSDNRHGWATIKYSGVGVAMWTNRYDGLGSYADAKAIAVDGNGNVFVTGGATHTNLYLDIQTIAYSSAGVALWTNIYYGPGGADLYANAIAVDSNRNVVVGTGGFADYATIKYSPTFSQGPRLDFQWLGNQLVLSWTSPGFNLQSATDASGTFTNVPGVTSPYTNTIIDGQQFFRLIQ